MTAQALIALKRFGLGQTRHQLAEIASDPRGYVSRQIDGASGLSIKADLPTSAEIWFRQRSYAKARRKAIKSGDSKAVDSMSRPRDYDRELDAHIEDAIGTNDPLLRRLAWFWTDHFCVSAKKGLMLRHLSGSYAREAIFPHILGNFRDMLQASFSHPAMLIYLDNDKSIGPNSPIGKKKNKGLNENLAREILELHTLGVNGGYDQNDVNNFARALTGWTVWSLNSKRAGTTRFHKKRHEPGPVEVLGKVYRHNGKKQATAILDDLARHPSTARFIAQKLATHFVGDDAPKSLVDRLAKVFAKTNGDLRAVHQTLIDAPECWEHPPTKFLPPLDMMVTTARALDIKLPAKFVRRTLKVFGQEWWGPPSPAGWPAQDNAWMSADALLERLDWTKTVTQIARNKIPDDVMAYANDMFGENLAMDTRQAIEQAENKGTAMILMLLSAEAQRR